MSITTARYVRKPVYVEAVEVTKENFAEILRWCQGRLMMQNGDGDVVDDVEPNPGKHYIHVRVFQPKDIRQTRLYVGDWLLYTEHGGYKVYTPKAFRNSFILANATAEPDGPQCKTSEDFKFGDPESVAQSHDYPEPETIGGTPREEINVGVSVDEVTPEQ